MKPFTMTTVLFLALLAAFQFARFIFGWPVTVEEMDVPVWASAIVAVVAGALAAMLWYENYGWHLPPVGNLMRRTTR